MMKKSITSIVIVALSVMVMLPGRLFAQNELRERVYLQTDKQTYLAGELLWVKLYLTDSEGKPLSFSRVGYVELTDGSIAQQQVKIEIAENGIGEGWVELPATLPTGYYLLTAYTRYMQNEGEPVYFRKTIGIVNTVRADKTILADDSPVVTPPVVSDNTVTITTNQAVFARRSQGEVRLTGLPEDLVSAGISIAGTEFIPVPDEVTINRWSTHLTSIPQPIVGNEFVPEYEGHIITAKLVDINTGDITSGTAVNTLLGFTGNDIRLFGGHIDKDGNVLFVTKRISGRHELATATYTPLENKYRADIQSPFVMHSKTDMPVFRLNPAWEEDLIQRNMSLQVIQAFTADSLSRTAPVLPHFQWKSDKSYLLEEYTRFPTLRETFLEFIPSLTFNIINGKRYLLVLKEDRTNVLLGNSLVLLDGIPIMDHEVMYNYNPMLIRKIEVFRDNFSFGGQLFEGIVSFTTAKNDYPELKTDASTQLFNYEGTQQHRYFYAPDYPDEASRANNRLPDYRHTLLWIPDVDTNGQQAVSIPFNTSDLTGEFQVTVEGITKSGKVIRGVYPFKVE